LFAILGLSFLLGMRHATDPDHLVAVGTVVARERSARSAVSIGALWGLGHTVTIVAVGGAIVLFGLVIPPRLGLVLEMAVAALLVVLGALNLTGAPPAQHGLHADEHVHRGSLLRHLRSSQVARPIVTGFVHGLAGSAAIALLVLTTIHDARWAVVYLAVFGIGTVSGMMLLTLGMGVPLARAAAFSGHAGRRLVRLTGLVSVVFGLVLAYRVGFSDGLLTGIPHFIPR
jgi:high-affinity nickel-transport protein